MGNDETKDLKKELEKKLKDKIEFKKNEKQWDANGKHFWISGDEMKDCHWHTDTCYFIIDQKTNNDKTLITYHFPYGNDACEKIGECLDSQYTVMEDSQNNKRILVAEIEKDNIDAVINSIKVFIENLKEKNNDINEAISSINQFPTKQNPNNVIFYGAPGTGKTFAVKDFLTKHDIKEFQGEANKNEKGYYRWVQFHPSFTYEDFIEGIKPTGVAKNGSVKLELVNGIFKDFCKQALKDITKPYYFVVDEINRANLSTVFGETLSLLEPSYRDPGSLESDFSKRNLIDTQYSTLESYLDSKGDIFYDSKYPGKFGIPENVYFIGMMNDVDKSIDAFDLALRRRFKWIRKDCNYDVIEEVLSKTESNIDGDSIETYINSCKNLNNYISGDNSKSLNLGKSYEFGHSFFLKIIEFLTSKSEKKVITPSSKKLLFDNYLRPTLKEYLRSEVNSEKELEKKLKEAKYIFTKTDE